jgi:hypothetical protein
MKKTAIWVIENITGELSFYTSLRIMMTVSSVINWKKWNDTITELHIDSLSYSIFKKLGILKCWDKVYTEIIDESSNIDKKSFWSSSKLRVLAKQNKPVILVDWDFIAFTDLVNLDKESSFVYSYDEDGRYVYPAANDEYIKKLTNLPDYLRRPESHDAINVSYLCFNDLEFQKEYAKQSLDCMLELSSLGAPNGSYVCFAEQKILKQLALHHKVSHRPLIKNIFNALRGEWTNNLNNFGIWNREMMCLKFEHYGPSKSLFKKNGTEFNFLCNSIKSKLSSKVIQSIIDLD